MELPATRNSTIGRRGRRQIHHGDSDVILISTTRAENPVWRSPLPTVLKTRRHDHEVRAEVNSTHGAGYLPNAVITEQLDIIDAVAEGLRPHDMFRGRFACRFRACDISRTSTGYLTRVRELETDHRATSIVEKSVPDTVSGYLPQSGQISWTLASTQCKGIPQAAHGISCGPINHVVTLQCGQ